MGRLEGKVAVVAGAGRVDDETWDFVLNVNLRTAFHTTRAADYISGVVLPVAGAMLGA